MKIVQAVGWYHPDSLGGTEVYVAALCQRLREAGHEVVVAAPDPRADAVRRYEHDGIPVFRYPIPPSPTRAEAQGEVVVRGAPFFHEWLGAQRPDVVHVHTFVTGLGLHEIRAARAAGARVFATTHASSLGFLCQRGTLMRWGEEPCDGVCRPAKCAACALQQRGLPKAAAWALAVIPPSLGRALPLPGRVGTALGMSALIAHNQERQREMLEAVDRFVLLTAWSLEALVANGFPRARLALNRLGVSQRDTAPKPSPDERPTKTPVTIGYLGRFEVIKGVHHLIRAVTSLPADVPLRLEVRGPVASEDDRRMRADLQALAAGDARIAFEPPVPPERIPEVLASYDLLCCPSVCHEGGPTVALEAQAVGTPVVGSRIGGLAEIVSDGVNGRLLPPGDERALAAAIREAALDPRRTIDVWRRSLPAVRTMDDVARDYLSLYAEQRG